MARATIPAIPFSATTTRSGASFAPNLSSGRLGWMRQFKPGQTIEMREVARGKTWELRYGVVVCDEREVITIFTAAGTPARVAADASGGRLRLPAGEWQLIDVLVPEDRNYLA